MPNNLDHLDHHKIAQANELVEAVAKMDTLPMKLFEIAVGAVDSTAASDKYRTVEISKQLIQEFLPRRDAADVTQRTLARVMQDLRESSGFEIELIDEYGQRDTIGIQPITQTEVKEDRDHVSITFSPEIMPYITELKKNFTQYSLEDIGNLSSKNSIAIYKLLMKSYNRYLNLRKRGREANESTNPIIDVRELRRVTNVLDKYRNFTDFNRFVISKAVKDITQHTSFAITYDKIKSGRYVTQVQFHIKGQNNKPSDGLTAQPTANLKQPATADLTEFLTNRYTAMLMANQLINPTAITTNEALRLDYLTRLYPLYTEFTAKYDGQKLQQHLAYVAEHKSGDANLDYLIHALADYQSKLAHPASTLAIATNRPKRNRINESLPTWARDDEPYVAEPVSAELIQQSKEALARLRQQEKELDNQSKQ